MPYFFLARFLAIFAAAFIVRKLLLTLHARYVENHPALKNYSGLIRVFVSVGVYVLFLLIFLDTAGISITPIIASLGVGGIAVALAFQETLSNLFAGFYMLIDKPIRVGDFVKLESGDSGYVESIGWRCIRIRMLPNNLVILPNSKLAGSVITNYHYPDKEIGFAIEVGVDYSSSLEKVEVVTLEVAREVLKTVPGGVPESEPAIRFHAFGDSSINFSVLLRAREYVDQFLLKHEFIKRLHRRYQQEGITIPFPVRTVYLQNSVTKLIGAILIAIALFWSGVNAWAAECKPPKVVVKTVVGINYCADPVFNEVIAANVRKIRQEIRAHREAGKMIIYVSTPISSLGGGDFGVNLEIAAAIKAKLEREYGSVVWALDPGRYQMPSVDGKSAGGSEYMVMWTEVLVGEDGLGKDFDMVHFTGPDNMRSFFGCRKEGIGDCIARAIDLRSRKNQKFREEVTDKPERRFELIRYYTMRASNAYSKGAHDEWNIFVKINQKRSLGDQIPLFFDGRPLSPAEMETEILPGYEFR